MQRRQALFSARLQMRRKTFESDAHLLSSITLERMAKAQDEEAQGRQISDPVIQLLRRHIYATGGRVMGSDHARYQLRSQIWGTTLMLNPPSIWITINPCDLHDPLAQVFAGEDVSMDNLLRTVAPSKEKRAQNIAHDPYAAAMFFHFIIHTILRTLFGVEVTIYQVKSSQGVLGPIASYFGTVESQGRGSLHLHMLVWLKNAPPSHKINALLKTEDFREKVRRYIAANFRAYLPGFESEESIKGIRSEDDIAWSRPPNPKSKNYDREVTDLEQRVARSKQLHKCEIRRCLVPDKRGYYRCKRRAPFPLSPDDVVDSSGYWNPKRLYAYVNGWVPALTVNVWCNNDGKLLTSGKDTKNVAYYVTNYAAKKQGKTYNLSAILAKGYAYHLKRPSTYIADLRDQQRLLLFRLVHTINREQELAAPMVISYLMGWEDTYRSHKYVTIYWSTFLSALLRTYPELSLAPRDKGKNR